MERALRRRGRRGFFPMVPPCFSRQFPDMHTGADSELNALSYEVIGLAMRIHTELGAGMRESVYEGVLATRLREAGHRIRVQTDIRIRIGSDRFDRAFRADLIIDDLLLIEVKCVRGISAEHIKQVASYLRFTKLPLGLVLNFAAPSMRQGIKRVINTRK